MGYTINLCSKDKKITLEDFNRSIGKLSKWNIGEPGHGLRCDVALKGYYVRISGSFSMSGTSAEGFALNLLINLQSMGYKITVISSDWEYGSEQELEWFNKINLTQ
jgi:hypothetical protein